MRRLSSPGTRLLLPKGMCRAWQREKSRWAKPASLKIIDLLLVYSYPSNGTPLRNLFLLGLNLSRSRLELSTSDVSALLLSIPQMISSQDVLVVADKTPLIPEVLCASPSYPFSAPPPTPKGNRAHRREQVPVRPQQVRHSVRVLCNYCIDSNPVMRPTKRRRLTSSGSPVRRSARSKRATWLDKLPEEVCERLAAHVCHRNQSLDGLALAKTSPALRRATIAALGHRLVIHDKRSLSDLFFAPKKGNWDTATTRKWISVMGEDLKEIDQQYLRTLGSRHPLRFTLSIFSLPNLRVAQITDHPAHLAAVAHSSSIQELSIAFRGYTSATEVFRTLSKLPLQKLKTGCPEIADRRPNYQCPLQDPEVTRLALISESLPRLDSIDVSTCGCYNRSDDTVWRNLGSLNSLREVTFLWFDGADRFSQEVITFLSGLDSVRIICSPFAHDLAVLIGAAVTVISYPHGYISLLIQNGGFTAAHVRDLQNLPRLKNLSLHIIQGAEEELPEVVRKLPELTDLDLVFVQSALESRERCQYSGSLFATASPGTMLRTVQAAPHLSTLCVGQVRIRLVELDMILKSIGARLRSFETSICDQEESPFDRLEALVLTAAKYNVEVREFWVDDIGHRRGPTPLEEWKRQAKQVLAGLRFLQKRAPYVRMRDMDVRIASMVAS